VRFKQFFYWDRGRCIQGVDREDVQGDPSRAGVRADPPGSASGSPGTNDSGVHRRRHHAFPSCEEGWSTQRLPENAYDAAPANCDGKIPGWTMDAGIQAEKHSSSAGKVGIVFRFGLPFLPLFWFSLKIWPFLPFPIAFSSQFWKIRLPITTRARELNWSTFCRKTWRRRKTARGA